MSMKREQRSRPLIEECDGRDADNRSSLFAAFRRISNRTNKPGITNLHVRELLLYVLAADRTGSGVQKSYPEIAELLETTVSTARAVVRRASIEFGLLAVIEDRHSRGGQTANRYSIDWPVVREINMGRRPAVVSQQAAVVSQQAPVATQQAPVATRQPYKELHPEFNPEAKASPSRPQAITPDPSPTPGAATWEAVEEVLAGILSDWRTALRAAQANKVTPDHVADLIASWRKQAPRLGPGALYQRLRNAHPNLTPELGWPSSPISAPAPRLAQMGGIRADSVVQANCIISRITKELRRAGRSEPEIRSAAERELAAAGLRWPE